MQKIAFRILTILMIVSFVFSGSPSAGQAKPPVPPPTAVPSRILQSLPDQFIAAPGSASGAQGALTTQAIQASALGQPGTSYRLLGQFGQNPQPAPKPYPADNAHLNHPFGLYVDALDQVWVSENIGSRVLKANSSFPAIGAAGASYTDDYVLGGIWDDMAKDKNGKLWIADDRRVAQYDVSGAAPLFLQNFPADSPDVNGSGNDRLDGAQGIAFDNLADQHMFVSDYNNHRVQVFRFVDGAPVYLNTIGDPASPGNDNTHFQNPSRSAVDGSNRLFFIDQGNQRVMRCESATGWTSFTCAPLAVGSALMYPQGIASSPAGDVYISDSYNQRILKCALGEGPCTVFASFTTYVLSDIGVDSAGNVYGADWDNNVVRKFSSTGSPLPIFSGELGVPYVTAPGYLNRPYGITLAPDGSIYVVESRGLRLVKLDPAGSQLWAVGTPGVFGMTNTQFGDGELFMGGNPAVDAAGRVYISDTANHRVQIYTDGGAYFNTLGVPGQSGQDNFHFYCPSGLAFNPLNGDLLVADACNNRVQVFDANRAYKATLGVTGQAGADNMHFQFPINLAFDAAGAVYIADTNNQRVQKCSYTRGANYACETFFGETGVVNGDFAHAHPVSVAIDAAGRVLVGDQWNNRVLVLDAAGKFLTAFGDRWGMAPASLSTIGGVALDSSGSVYVTDYADSRVLKFGLGVPGWRQLNLDGFGSRGNMELTAMATFGGKLYAGMGNPGTYGDARGGQIWRQSPGGDWEQVVSGGFGYAYNYGIDDLLAFNGSLYASTWTDNGASGGEIWRSPSGNKLSWTRVVAGGSGTSTPDHANSEFFDLFVDGGQLCATTWADTNVHGSEIWCSPDGASWTRRAANGLGDQNNMVILSVQRYGDYLYAGTWNDINGGKVYRTKDWSTWETAATSGAGSGRYPLASGLKIFKGYLYAAWGHAPGGPMTLTRCQICDGSDWQVIPQAASGFGNPNNSYNPALAVVGDSLYLIVGNSVDGAQVWKSPDGLTWTSAALSGFGLPNNTETYWDHALLVDSGMLYAGVFNYSQGAQIWRMDSALFVPLIQR